MWLAKPREEEQDAQGADLGSVTLSAEEVSVFLDGERRGALPYTAAGITLKSQTGDSVLTLHRAPAWALDLLGRQPSTQRDL